MWFFFVSFVIIMIGYFIGMILRFKYFFLKPFRTFYKDLDLEALEQSVHKRQALPDVHPETINLYNILMIRHCISHSKDKGREYFKKIYLPKTKGYVFQYRGLLLRYGLTKEEFDNAYEVLKKEFYNNKTALKNLDKFYKFWSPYYGTNPTVDISKIYKFNRKNNAYQNAI
ncbi:MAG: hypothetical protein K2J93_03530, partial [Anaeroplasmataceae bacterium]|nr:hypothetical protein [Anaeroplasmataceae bacterium]